MNDAERGYCEGCHRNVRKGEPDCECDGSAALMRHLATPAKGVTAQSEASERRDAVDAARYRFRHSSYVDKDGFEYGYAKVKWGVGFGAAAEIILWATDDEIDRAMLEHSLESVP